jgi:hypothetical protein
MGIEPMLVQLLIRLPLKDHRRLFVTREPSVQPSPETNKRTIA